MTKTIICPQNKGGKGALILKFWLIEGALIQRGLLFEGGANSRIYGMNWYVIKRSQTYQFQPSTWLVRSERFRFFNEIFYQRSPMWLLVRRVFARSSEL